MEINGINITVQRKNIKNMYLRVLPPEGSVKISAPYFISNDAIIEFVNSRMDWILDKQAKIKNKEYIPPLKYVSGEKHMLWGDEYNLQLRPKAMLIEAGAQTNTFEEELNAMEVLADIMNKVLG